MQNDFRFSYFTLRRIPIFGFASRRYIKCLQISCDI